MYVFFIIKEWLGFVFPPPGALRSAPGRGDISINRDVYLPVHALLQRDESFSSDHSRDVLDFVVEELHEVEIVLGIDLYEHRVRSCREMTFHHFGDSF